ncbi:helix-turn-helix transcriptional regulator [Phycicoccus sp. BSK3Z-2]|uniref:Helix-turn-helix transcriptional regulator n=1 Tax=Phycicoccus avicenniae TaxID=2828860 RepID=A0A941D906_9MICO|nr:helix-turn-helix transcriptional regulator [Phycicoccus avicenniae]MBR7744118.1 helix-turn-helix transcriptional regulator [Phycicoccus avicenniae]
MSTPPREQVAFFRWAHDLVLEGDERLRPLGEVEDAMARGLDEVARAVRHTVWHMTAIPSWAEARAARALEHAARRPGVDGRYVTADQALSRLPMLSSHHLGMRVAPVVAPLLVLDRTRVFVGAPRGYALEGTVWTSTVPHVVAAAAACFEGVWDGAVPAAHDDPPFTQRMVDIGFLLTEGATDREIARDLGVSERTISNEVAEIVRRLGARGRAHAIACITGNAF